MNQSSIWLLQHSHNVYSQTGEDGIIEKILEIFPEKSGWCVEFGAWDGMHLTNTRNLIESKGYAAVLIEANAKRFKDLQRNYAEKHDVVTINKYVGFTDDDGLDLILEGTPIPTDFDLLSIDIDGNDYHVWKSVVKYRPKVVVIEFNPTIPTHIHFVQPPDPAINQGSSLLAFVELASGKGYELVSVTPFNAFFVRREYYELFHIESNAPELLRTELGLITYIFSGYDGRFFLHGNRRLPWHRIKLKDSKFQQVPRFLRTFPGNYTLAHRALLWAYRLIAEPGASITELKKRLNNGGISKAE